MKVIIATNNDGKVRELKKLLSPLGYDAVSLRDEGILISVAEDGMTFAENAAKKARAVYDIVKLPVIADDSGLEIDFLNGEPGVFSARYGGENLTDSDRNRIVLEKLDGVPKEQRTARFISVICFIDKDSEIFAEGEIRGFIGYEPIGNNGFGYDPVFMLNENTSMAMLGNTEKNAISHRGKAAAELIKRLQKGKNTE